MIFFNNFKYKIAIKQNLFFFVFLSVKMTIQGGRMGIANLYQFVGIVETIKEIECRLLKK